MTREEGEKLGYDWLDIAPTGPVVQPAKYTFREACLMNGFDPDLPVSILVNADEAQ